MSDGNMSYDSIRQKRTRFAALEAPSEAMVKQTFRSPIDATRYHLNFHAVTLHDKLSKMVVCCAADFMTRRQNLHYKISSKHKLNTDYEYVPNSAQIKLELAVE